jgi:hypothetical protein
MAFVGELVQTPYGPAKIQSLRDDTVILIPFVWRLANRQEPYFYLNPADVKSYFSVGDLVSTQYGTGHITSIRTTDGVYVVILENWHLATGKSPVLFLQAESLQLIKAAPHSILEKAIAAVEETAHAISHKVVEAVEAVEKAAAPVIEEAVVAIQEAVQAAEDTAEPIVEEVVAAVREAAEEAEAAVAPAVQAVEEAAAPVIAAVEEAAVPATTPPAEQTASSVCQFPSSRSSLP